MIFKCLSIRQPWAELIVSGQRGMEIRSWYTSYRGIILIHASLKTDKKGCERFSMDAKVTGAIMGFVSILEIKKLSAREWKLTRPYHLEAGNRPYGSETYGWRLANPKKFADPVPWKGRLGLFDIDKTALPPLDWTRGEHP